MAGLLIGEDQHNWATGTLGSGVTGGAGLSLVNQPCFLVEGDGTHTSCTNGAYTRINFPVITYDPGSYYTTGTDRWTPTNGSSKYYFVFVLTGVNTADNYDSDRLSIRKNDTSVAETRYAHEGSNVGCTSSILLLDGVDDYIDIYIRHDTDGVKNNMSDSNTSRFGAFAISG